MREDPIIPDAAITTLVDLLRMCASSQPNQLAYRFLARDGQEEICLTYQELDQRACTVAARLQSLHLQDERILLVYPPGINYITAFFGCLYAGAIAVPCYPPHVRRFDARLQAIQHNAQAKAILTIQKYQAVVNYWLESAHESVHCLLTDEIDLAEAECWIQPELQAENVAFLQYTSGSTGTPRGVRVTHHNLLHNLSWIHRCFGVHAASRVVIWLPPYHDMGLIGGLLLPLYSAIPVTLFSPTAFLEQPRRWLEVISQTHATISGAPNFAYDLCVQKITSAERATLDLSSWEVAFNGAEPVNLETLEKFTAAFEQCGFRHHAFYPCYGLAEATLLVSGSSYLSGPIIQSFSATALTHNRVREVVEEEQDSRKLVSCGIPHPDQTLLIVDPVTCVPCPLDTIGEVWILGPGVADGYWQNTTESARTFQGTLANGHGLFLRTGDLGFLHYGSLFIAGRLKDMIIIRGRNYYPQDIEHTCERSHSALRHGAVAAFSLSTTEEERLVLVQEVKRQALQADSDELVIAIRRSVAQEHGLHIYAVVLIKPGTLPKTTSGKVQRQHCLELFKEQRLAVIGQSILGDERSEEISLEEGIYLQGLLKKNDAVIQQELVIQFLQRSIGRLLGHVEPFVSLDILSLDSLMAVELKNDIERLLGIVISVSHILQSETITQLAAYIVQQLQNASSSMKDSVMQSALSSTGAYALACNQQALWFLYLLLPGDRAYIISRAMRLRGQLHLAALQRAFHVLRMRHSALRTVFLMDHSEPQQVVQEKLEDFFQHEDLTNSSAEQIQQRLNTEAQRTFDLEHHPALRVHVFTCSEQEHILLLSVHHILVDFWSLIILMHELQLLYESECTGRSLELPTLTTRYVDYVTWQSHFLQSAAGDEVWRYWQRQLVAPLSMLELPLDFPRPLEPSRSAATYSFSLSALLTQRLKELTHAHSATLYTTLMAAFVTLLHRYTNQSDLLIGTTVTGRNRASFMDVVGYFVNLLAIRTHLSGSMSFNAVLQQVRHVILSAFEYQDFPFVELVNRIQPQRDARRSPLFQIVFTFQQTPSWSNEALSALALDTAGVQLAWQDLSLEWLPLEKQSAQFDILCMMAESNDTLIGSIQYDTNLFLPTTIERFAAHFQVLLESLVAQPEQPIAYLQLLPYKEQQHLLAWNETAVAYPQDRTVQALFEEQVASFPQHIAVRYKDELLTYDQLNRRANRLAHMLRDRGVGPEIAVGLYMEREFALVVGMLGILKAGGYYVPLDSHNPVARLAFLLEDAHVQVLLTQQHLQEQVLSTDVQVITLDTDWWLKEADDETNPFYSSRPEHLAYVIYTSGSAGRPKGVMIDQRSLVNYLLWCRSAYPFQQGEGIPVHSTVAFDLTVTSLLAPLIAGSTVILLPEGLQIEALAEAFRQNTQFSLVKLTPAHLKLLGEQLDGEEFSSAGAFIIGGEALLANHLAFWRSTAPEIELVNEYGPTEAVVGCCTYRIARAGSLTEPIPIGRPITNVRLYILDQVMQPVPIGVAGELYIAGAGVARGYYNRPDLTAELFLPEPFGGEPGKRMYKTGDRARYLADGTVQFLGRIDHQVKIRGYRIELEEIISVLTQHYAVQDAVVLVVEKEEENQQLVAYVLLKEEGILPAEMLRDFLREWLPEYMVPVHFVMVAQFPLTTNGKIDLSALRQQFTRTMQSRSSVDVPRSEVEQILCQIWQDILHVSHVGISENFFDLGGHSLLLVQLQRHIKERLEQDFPLLDLLKHSTVRAMATYIKQAHAEKDVPLPQSLLKSRTRAETRLNAMQQRQRYRGNRT